MRSSTKLRYISPLAATVAALLGAAACGGSGESTTGTGGGSSSSSSSSGSTSSSSSSSSSGSGGQAPVCPGMGYSGGEVAAEGGTVTATLIDQNGAPVAGQPVYICGTDLCSPAAMSGADGKVSITTTLTMKKPAFKFGDAVTYSELAIPLTMMTTDLGTVGTVKLPSTGSALTPGADATSGMVKVSVPAGAGVSVNELIYDTPEKQAFRAAELPLDKAGVVISGAQVGGAAASFEIVYGAGPAGATICPAAKVSVPNTKGWAAGTAVEFFVMTVDTGQEFAPYAGWAKMSDGAVSADGATIATADGGGFIYLDNFAIRKKP